MTDREKDRHDDWPPNEEIREDRTPIFDRDESTGSHESEADPDHDG